MTVAPGHCSPLCSAALLVVMKGVWCRYAFHKEPAGGKDEPGTQKERLLKIFGHWTDMVTDLIRATPEEDVIRRDIFDRPPIFKWTEVGRLCQLHCTCRILPWIGLSKCEEC